MILYTITIYTNYIRKIPKKSINRVIKYNRIAYIEYTDKFHCAVYNLQYLDIIALKYNNSNTFYMRKIINNCRLLVKKYNYGTPTNLNKYFKCNHSMKEITQ